MQKSYVYILTTRKNTALYVGITADLQKRIWEHKQGIASKHTKRYCINKLVYAEEFTDVEEAIYREKCIKKWKRDWKIELINKANPEWKELNVV